MGGTTACANPLTLSEIAPDLQKNKWGENSVTDTNCWKEYSYYMMNSLDLIDIWRILDPDACWFMWI